MATLSDKLERLKDSPQIQQPSRGRSLASDAFRRLRRNRAAVIGAVIIIANVLVALFAPVIAPKSYDDATLSDSNVAPIWVTRIFPGMRPEEEGGYVEISNSYLLGADELGRDLLSRILYGTRISIAVALVGPLISLTVGLAVGLVSGYMGGRVDDLLMRFVDIMYAFPTMLLIILMLAFFRTSLGSHEPGTLFYTLGKLDAAVGGVLFIFIGIGLTGWMNVARLVRGQVLSVRQTEYVEAAHAIGAPTSRIILRHVLPNILGPVVVAQTLVIPTYIAFEAFLSFIGLGVNPPTPSWGVMIADGAQVIAPYPNQALFPALALFLTMFAFNFLGDGLRDALDPTMRGFE